MPSGFINGDISQRRPRGKSGKGNATSFAAYDADFKRMVAAQAIEFQAQVVDEIRKDIKRPGAGNRTHIPGRLAQVTGNEGNRRVTSAFWQVGIPAYLDTSIAKYWRTIELGTAATWTKTPFQSLDLFGTFAGTNFIPLGNSAQRLAAIERGDKRIFHPSHDTKPMNAYLRVWEGRGWANEIRQQFARVVQIYL